MYKWPTRARAAEFYGDPDTDRDGLPNPAWEKNNLTSITPPFRMKIAWGDKREIRGVRIHKKCAPSLKEILERTFDLYGRDQAAIEKVGLHWYGGAYNYRLARGSLRLSTHSYGAAIDLNPASNPLGRAWVPRQGMIDLRVVDIFEEAGWVWGGRWSRPDCQHFQAVIE